MSAIEHEGGERLIGEYADALTRSMAGAEDESAVAARDRRQQRIVVVDAIFQIAVLDQNDVARRARETFPHSVTFAARPILQEENEIRPVAIRTDDLTRTVGGI